MGSRWRTRAFVERCKDVLEEEEERREEEEKRGMTYSIQLSRK